MENNTQATFLSGEISLIKAYNCSIKKRDYFFRLKKLAELALAQHWQDCSSRMLLSYEAADLANSHRDTPHQKTLRSETLYLTRIRRVRASRVQTGK